MGVVMNLWTLHFDGLCEPRNPGGWRVWSWTITGENIDRWGSDCRRPNPGNTNNRAEWYALGVGIKSVCDLISEIDKPESLVIKGDSKLVISQLNKEWECRNPHLIQCRDKALNLLGGLLIPWTGVWIPREQNHKADSVGRETYKSQTGSYPRERMKAAIK